MKVVGDIFVAFAPLHRLKLLERVETKKSRPAATRRIIAAMLLQDRSQNLIDTCPKRHQRFGLDGSLSLLHWAAVMS
jgi:hypothetical protein